MIFYICILTCFLLFQPFLVFITKSIHGSFDLPPVFSLPLPLPQSHFLTPVDCEIWCGDLNGVIERWLNPILAVINVNFTQILSTKLLPVFIWVFDLYPANLEDIKYIMMLNAVLLHIEVSTLQRRNLPKNSPNEKSCILLLILTI